MLFCTFFLILLSLCMLRFIRFQILLMMYLPYSYVYLLLTLSHLSAFELYRRKEVQLSEAPYSYVLSRRCHDASTQGMCESAR